MSLVFDASVQVAGYRRSTTKHRHARSREPGPTRQDIGQQTAAVSLAAGPLHAQLAAWVGLPRSVHVHTRYIVHIRRWLYISCGQWWRDQPGALIHSLNVPCSEGTRRHCSSCVLLTPTVSRPRLVRNDQRNNQLPACSGQLGTYLPTYLRQCLPSRVLLATRRESFCSSNSYT